MRTTGAPMSRAEILLPVNASNSACMETTQFVMYFPKSIQKPNNAAYKKGKSTPPVNSQML
jgi:hypothetical protein